MRDFSFHNPTRMEFGRDKERHIGQYLREYGIESVLLVYGSERIKKDGLFGRVEASLAEQGIAFEELGGVVSNPLLSRVQDGVSLMKSKKLQAVLAVGGGSVLDSAKAIAAGALYDGDVWDFFVQKAAITDASPVFAVLTLAATGSEMNAGAVVTNDETKAKYAIMASALFPKVSVINPELMATVSHDYLAYSAVDIFAHCLDLYFSAKTLPEINAALIENILHTVMRTTDALLAEPSDYDARAEFAWASTMALNGITFVGAEGNAYPSHLVEHSLSALYNVPHGAGLSIVLPGWMRWYKEQNPARFERFAEKMFGASTADVGIDALVAWFSKIGSPVTLAEAEIPVADIPAITENAFGLSTMWGQSEVYTKQAITEILELSVS